MKHIGKLFGGLFALGLLCSLAYAATSNSPVGGVIYTWPGAVTGAFTYLGGPQSSAVKASGGTVTCTGGGTPTITNSTIDANSVVMFGLKTAGGTPAVPIMTSIVVGTSFVITCGGSDTSVYNYVILG